MAKRGPKTFVYTEEHLQIIEDSAAKGLPEYLIANKIGRSKGEFSRDKKKWPEISHRLKKGVTEIVEMAGDCLRERMMGGDTTAIIFVLKCKGLWNDRRFPKAVKSKLEDLQAKTLLSVDNQTLINQITALVSDPRGAKDG